MSACGGAGLGQAGDTGGTAEPSASDATDDFTKLRSVQDSEQRG